MYADLVTSADDEDYYSILLIDASNPLNCVKCDVMLLTACFAWYRISYFICNLYRADNFLVLFSHKKSDFYTAWWV